METQLPGPSQIEDLYNTLNYRTEIIGSIRIDEQTQERILAMSIINLTDEELARFNVSRSFRIQLSNLPPAGRLLIPATEIIRAIRGLYNEQVDAFINQLPMATEAVGWRIVHQWFPAEVPFPPHGSIVLARMIDGLIQSGLTQFHFIFAGR